MEQELKAELEKRILVPRIIWGAILVSSLIYPLIAYVTFPHRTPPSGTVFDYLPSLGDPVEQLFLLMAFGSLAAAVLLPSKLYQSARIDLQGSAAEQAGALQAKYFIVFVIKLALLESISIYGLVATIMTGLPGKCLLFAAVAVGGMILSFPTPEKIAEKRV